MTPPWCTPSVPIAVAGPEEGEVALDDLVEQRAHLPLDPVLDGGLGLRRIAGVERAAADEDARVVVEVERRAAARPPSGSRCSRSRGQPGEPEERGVLAVGGDVLGAGGQQEEGPHGRILGAQRDGPCAPVLCQGRRMPHRQAAQVVADLVQALLGVPTPWGVRCWDGSEAQGPPGAPTLVVTSPRALRRIVYSRDELGLARAYVSGDVEVDGDLFRMLEFPDSLLARPALHLDRSALRPLLGDLVHNGVLGLPVPPPPEESRLRGLRHSLRRDRAAISHHYDVGQRLLRAGPRPVDGLLVRLLSRRPTPRWRTPSATSSNWSAANSDLQPGQAAARRRLRLGLDGLHAAREYGVQRRRRHPLAPSRPRSPASGSPRRASTDRVEIRVQDYRDVTDGPYDAISSIGMAEHVGARGYRSTPPCCTRS